MTRPRSRNDARRSRHDALGATAPPRLARSGWAAGAGLMVLGGALAVATGARTFGPTPAEPSVTVAGAAATAAAPTATFPAIPTSQLLAIPTATPRGVLPVERAPVPVTLQDFPGSDYTGEFVFVRIKFDMDLGGFRGFGREPPWAHDYPTAERNFLRILEELTLIDRHPDGTKILTTDDPELFKFPVAYLSEPGYWRVSDAEVAGLRAWLLKGGFLIADDFRGNDWYTFQSVMEEVVPELRWVELDLEHEVFDSFFRVESLDFGLPPNYRGQMGRGGSPMYLGLYENNDPVGGRLMVVANYNNDIGDYWEWSDRGVIPIDLSNDAYELGVNYVVYALTH